MKCLWRQRWLPQTDWQWAQCLQAPRCCSLWSETSVPGTLSLTEQTFWVWLLITVSPLTPCILLTSFSQAVRLARLRRNRRFSNCICACTERKLKYTLVRSVQVMENVSFHSVLVWALQFVPGSFLVPEDREINYGFVWLENITKQKERKGNSLYLSVQTFSQMILAISHIELPLWAHLSWMAVSWIYRKSLFLYLLSQIWALYWCWSVYSNSSDCSLLLAKTSCTVFNGYLGIRHAPVAR